MIKHLNKYKYFYLIFLMGAFFRFYKLKEIPGEIWGDIVVGMEFMEKILSGRFPFYFVLGNGPIFFYLASLTSLLIGFNFLALKVTSVLIGLLLIIGGYLVSRQMFNENIAVITAFLLATSKYPVIFSRLGLMNIMVPTLISFVLYFFLRWTKENKMVYQIISALIMGIGLYVYPAFIVFPPLFCLLLIIYIVNMRKNKTNKNHFIVLLVVFMCFAIPFVKILHGFGFGDPNSYFGGKFFTTGPFSFGNFISRLFSNTVKHVLMFNFKGDIVFRVNPTLSPQLDFLSGIFFILGIVVLIFSEEKPWKKLFIIIPFVVLQLPSLLVINFPLDVPNATRSIGIIPFLYILVSIGVDKFLRIYSSYKIKKSLSIFILFSIILLQNFKQVFYDYPLGLPNKNTPYGRIIAEKLDKLPEDVFPYVYSCCWGDWGQPEIGGIKFARKNSNNVVFINIGENYCNYFSRKNKYYLILDPRYGSLIRDNELCGQTVDFEIQKSEFGDTVYLGVWNY